MSSTSYTASARPVVATLVATVMILAMASEGWASGSTCLIGTDPEVATDPAKIAATRLAVDAACPCSSYTGLVKGAKHGDYIKCAKTQIESAVLATTLRKECKGAVKKFYAKSTCGYDANLNKVPCAKIDSKGKVTCSIKNTTKSDGSTPNDKCVDKLGKYTQQKCTGETHCIDAADINGDLIIGAPGDNGSCVGSMPPPATSTPASTPTPGPVVLPCTQSCADGEAIVGFVGTQSAGGITQIAAKCAMSAGLGGVINLGVPFFQAGLVYTANTAACGSGGGTPFVFDCPTNQVVTAIGGYEVGGLVTTLGFTCAPIVMNISTMIASSSDGALVGYIGPLVGDPITPTSCSSDAAASGIDTMANGGLHQFNLLCSTLPTSLMGGCG